jgi:putative transcriptional regulator
MTVTKISLKPLSNPSKTGRVNKALLDGTTAKQIAAQAAQDDAAAAQDAAHYARRVRERLGLTQQALAARIEVPIDTIRNWEQGKRSPTGAAKALLKVLHHAPEAALAALR